MADAVDKLVQATGLYRDDLLGIWEQVKANHRVLAGCQRHDFKPIEPTVTTLGIKMRCANCGGTVNAVEAIWYSRGLEHGGRV